MSNPEQAVFNYQDEAQQTKSDKFYGQKVSKKAFNDVLMACIESLQTLDVLKKSLFYGKDAENETYSFVPNQFQKDCSDVNDISGLTFEQGADIIHSIIGKATEAGEQLELLFATIFRYTPFDATNFKEEIADGMWYDAIGLTAVGSNIEEVQRTNIAKLRARFPNKFTEYDANNRNLVAERKILES